MTDEEFVEFCSNYPDYFVEQTAEGELLIRPPNYSLTGARNQKINTQLDSWAVRDGAGISTEASAGFHLPNGARRSPDAAWTGKGRVMALSPAARERFWPFCPDFVIELKSHTDRLPTLRRKMREWIENGARLGWLIDPERRAVEIYRYDGEPEIRENAESVTGEGDLASFTLNLLPVWYPLAY